jgi:hypothetical protein
MPTIAPRDVFLPVVIIGSIAASPQTSRAIIRLVDVAEQAGITLLNICGGTSKDYIVDVNLWRSR